MNTASQRCNGKENSATWFAIFNSINLSLIWSHFTAIYVDGIYNIWLYYREAEVTIKLLVLCGIMIEMLAHFVGSVNHCKCFIIQCVVFQQTVSSKINKMNDFSCVFFLWKKVSCIFLAATKQLFEWYFLSVYLSVCTSVRLSYLFDYVPIIVSSWKFQVLSPRTRVRSMQKAKVRGQRSMSQRSQPNFTVSGL